MDNIITGKLNILNSHPPVINCEYESSRYSASIKVTDREKKLIAKFGFSSKTASTEVGEEIIKTAIVSWIIGKYRKALKINLNFDLDIRSFSFIDKLNSEVIGSLEDSEQPLLAIQNLTHLRIDNIISVPNLVFTGQSGGRDSLVSADILDKCNYSLLNYKIDYDQLNPSSESDYSTYEIESILSREETKYEPFDISLTYLAPLWSAHNRVPQHISIGHSFDVLGYNATQRKAPYESPLAIQLHQKYLNEILGTAPQFLFPLATLSTYSIFEYIRRHLGLQILENCVSCWNSTETDCGYCDKCQRIKLATTFIHQSNYDYLHDIPQVIDNHSYLFGHPGYNKLIAENRADDIAESQLFTNNLRFNDRIAEYLYKHFSNKYKSLCSQTDQNQSTEYSGDITKISKLLDINYDRLPKDRVNSLTRNLPYEQYFSRKVPIIAAHGEIPYYSQHTGWHYKRISDGPRLVVPDTILFRNFFSSSHE